MMTTRMNIKQIAAITPSHMGSQDIIRLDFIVICKNKPGMELDERLKSIIPYNLKRVSVLLGNLLLGTLLAGSKIHPADITICN